MVIAQYTLATIASAHPGKVSYLSVLPDTEWGTGCCNFICLHLYISTDNMPVSELFGFYLPSYIYKVVNFQIYKSRDCTSIEPLAEGIIFPSYPRKYNFYFPETELCNHLC